jgi:hypothetical protein
MAKKALFELALGAAGAVYLMLVFAQNISSPLFGLVLVTLAAYELAESHRARNKP